MLETLCAACGATGLPKLKGTGCFLSRGVRQITLRCTMACNETFFSRGWSVPTPYGSPMKSTGIAIAHALLPTMPAKPIGANDDV
jgi:hypothetical protein